MLECTSVNRCIGVFLLISEYVNLSVSIKYALSYNLHLAFVSLLVNVIYLVDINWIWHVSTDVSTVELCHSRIVILDKFIITKPLASIPARLTVKLCSISCLFQYIPDGWIKTTIKELLQT